MNVYLSKWEGSYGNGLAVIAAHSVEEAKSALMEEFKGECTDYDKTPPMDVWPEHGPTYTWGWTEPTLEPKLTTRVPMPLVIAAEKYQD